MGRNGNGYGAVIIGGGHAGCEAALACARLGVRTLLVTISMDHIALMPCNPSIGGPGKSHLVREIDALGGQMGCTADATRIQVRMLNTRKGPAVQSLRVQVDKKEYQEAMRRALRAEESLEIVQGMVSAVRFRPDGSVAGVETREGAIVPAGSVVLTGGTYLRGRIVLGSLGYPGGPQGQPSSATLSECLEEAGIALGRFKTGTPPRVDARTVDPGRMEPQWSDPDPGQFSFWEPAPERPLVPCHLTYTGEQTHRIIRENIDRAPLFSGAIQSRGPRYCPSIEDKVMRFPDKDRHQVFVEPEGLDSGEFYLQGLSTSLPLDVQEAVVRSVPGLEEARIVRPGYAIEYDYVDPRQLLPTLAMRSHPGLFCAGQINGTSGYEEAAAQGLLAGINAARRQKDQEPLLLDRTQCYLGVLVDDLVTRGVDEPYRIFTARSEYRLSLRQDNADLRLSPRGCGIGLLSPARCARLREKETAVAAEIRRLQETRVGPGDQRLQAYLGQQKTSALRSGASLAEILRRPEVGYRFVEEFFPPPEPLAREVAGQVEVEIKYHGYIEKQRQQVERVRMMEGRQLPADLEYGSVPGLTAEARGVLERQRPLSVGQASRLPGLSPADIAVLLVYLEKRRRG